MRILYICYHNPFGTSGGGALASHAYLRAFTDIAEGNLDLMCASNFRDDIDRLLHIANIYFIEDRTAFQKLMSPITGYMNRYVMAAKKHLSHSIVKYDYVIFDHNNIAGALVKFVNSLGIKTITIHHNYEKEYFSDNNKGIYKHIFLPHVIRLEKTAYRNSCLNLFLTRQDMNTFDRVYGYSKGKSYVIGAFEYYDYSPVPIRVKGDNHNLIFVITGSLNSYQTIDAIKYFFKELYCKLPEGCKVIISGRNPSDDILNLCSMHDNVTVIANPIDMNDIISNADVYICPTRLGGGLKLRVMDGLKNGLPVITHSCSARGFDAFYDEPIFKIFQTPHEFEKGLLELMCIIKSGNYSKERVQDIYKNFFSYEKGFERLLHILSEV